MKVKHLILPVVVAFAVWQPQVKAQVAVNLGSASNFAILGGSAITFTTGGVIITGDIGSYPITTVTGIGGVTAVSEPAATSMLIAGFLGLVVGVRRIRRHNC